MSRRIFLFCLAFILLGCSLSPPKIYKISEGTLKSCVTVRAGYGYGSGVYIRSNLVLTAGHCVEFNLVDVIDVYGNTANVVESWRSEKYDVGFLVVDAKRPTMPLGRMPKLLDEVYLIGTPYTKKLCGSISKGIVSALNRYFLGESNLIQTDAEGAAGSSGSPLCNLKWEIVGMCISGPTSGGGVTLCVPVTDIRLALEEYDAADIKRLTDSRQDD